MNGLALAFSDLPVPLIERHGLSNLLHERGGEKEFRFMRQVPNAILPVTFCGQTEIVFWGCRKGPFPKTGFTWLDTVERGEWANFHAEPCEIPATAGLQNGVWFPIRQGVRGIIAEAEGIRAVYMFIAPATYYYKIMTRYERMPVLIGETI